MHRFSPNLDQMNASVACLIVLFALQVTSFAATVTAYVASPEELSAKIPVAPIYLGRTRDAEKNIANIQLGYGRSGLNSVREESVDSDADGIPDFAQLDAGTKESLRLVSPGPVGLASSTAMSSIAGESPAPRKEATGATESATSGAAPQLNAPDPLKWTIQENTSRRAKTSHVTDPSLDFDSVIPRKPSDLRLAIDRVETSESRREFRISVSGIQSLDQAVDVWVSNDLQTWNKLEDSVIEISGRGERRIQIPLDSRMQFFRVTLSE